MTKRILSLFLALCLLASMLPAPVAAAGCSGDFHTGNVEVRDGYEATCTEEGYTGYIYCADCGAFLDYGDRIPALSHDMGDWAPSDVPCYSGYQRSACQRPDCDYEELLGSGEICHDYSILLETVPVNGCASSGYELRQCAVCGVTIKTNWVAAAPHDFSVLAEYHPADCNNCAWGYDRCSGCDQVRYWEEGDIDPTNHDISCVNALEATHTTDGYTGDTICYTCDIVVEAGTVIPATGHNFGAWQTLDSPCYTSGGEVRFCSGCTYREVRNADCIGHNTYEGYSYAPTCDKTGLLREYCSQCNWIFETILPATGHDLYFQEATATCTERGYGEDCWACSYCGEGFVDPEGKIPSGYDSSHDWRNHVNIQFLRYADAPDCTDCYGDYYLCLDCGMEFREEIPLRGHDFADNTCTHCGQQVVDYGSMDDAYWCLDTAGTLTIYGSGTLQTPTPWEAYADQITAVVQKGSVSVYDQSVYDSRFDFYVPTGVEYPNLTTIFMSQGCDGLGTMMYLCPNLLEITVEEGNPYLFSQDGVLYSSYGVEILLVRYPAGRSDTTFVVPETVYVTTPVLDDDYVSTITDFAFYQADSLEYIQLSKSVHRATWGSFAGCTSLKEFRYLSGNDYAMTLNPSFIGCTSLERVWLSDKMWLSDDFADCDNIKELYVLNPNTIFSTEVSPEGLIGDPAVTVIYGYAGSSAHAYAERFGYQFRELTHCHIHSHLWDYGVTTMEPTEESEGEIRCTCSNCRETKTEPLPKLEHTHNYEAVITDPTCTENGYTTYTCKCGDSYVDDEVAALGHDWVDNVCSRCGEVRENPFGDVKETDYFLNPVLWAVENGITSGTGAGQFSPEDTCTRAQVVTFLWRAVGKPEPASDVNPFDDVNPSDYYYKAVLWAVENGVTAGTSAGKFSPEASCTRGQVVTFMWRAMGKEIPETDQNPFGDVKDTDYFYQPVLWAVENGITAGTGAGKFAPDDSCTRGQVVTFLYRAMANK